MIRRFWNYLTDYEQAASGVAVISSLVLAATTLVVGVVV
jgi:hypothetical protein